MDVFIAKTTRLDFPSGKWITAEEICETLQDRTDKPKLMIFSACSVCNEDLIECLKKVGVKYVIGPEEDVYWFDAAIFLTIFYRLFLVEKRTPWMAYRNTERIRKIFLPQLTGTWLFFENGKLCYSAPYSRNKIGKKVCMNYFY